MKYYTYALMLIVALSAITCASPAPTYLLPEIIVHSHDQNIQTSPDSSQTYSIISQKDIKASGAQSIPQALSQNASVQSYDQTGANPVFYIRGHRASVLLNGVPLNQFDSSGQNLSSIPISSIEKIKVSNDSNSVQNGSMGMGGTIDIITKSAKQAKNHVSISASHPTYGQIDTSFQHQFNNGLSLTLSNSAQNKEDYRDFSRQINNATQLTLAKKYQTGKLVFTLNNGYQNLQFPGGLSTQQKNQNPWQSSTEKENYLTHTLQLTLNWHQNLSKKAFLQNIISYQDMRGKGSAPDSKFFKSFTQNYQNIQLLPSLNIKSLFFGKKTSSKIGIDFSHQTFSQSSIINNAQQTNISPFLESFITLNKKIQTGGGFRLAYINTSGNFKSPPPNSPSSQSYQTYAINSFLKYKWTPQFSNTFRIARAYQLPFIDQSNLAYSEGSTTTFGLKPQTSISYSLDNNLHLKKFSANLNFYLMNTKNQIYYNPAVNANVNLAPTQQIGIILNTNYQLLKPLSIGGSLNFMRNRFKAGLDSGNTVPGQPYLQAEMHSLWQINHNLSFYLQEQFNSTQYADSDLKNNAGKVAPYWLTNLAFNYQLKSWDIKFRINNLFNTYYYNYVTVFQNGSTLEHSYYPANGINGMLTLGYTFS